MDQNSFNITGRLVKDAVRRLFPKSGKAFLDFSVANNTGTGDYASTQYFNCILVGDKRSEALVPYLNKGTHVALTGSLETNNWTGGDGSQHYDFKYKIDNVVLLGKSNKKADLFGEDGEETEHKKFNKPKSNEITY